MEDILAKSVNEQQAIGSRVAALLAGTSLTTTSGVEIRRRDPVEEIGYETVGKIQMLNGWILLELFNYTKYRDTYSIIKLPDFHY